MTTALAPQQPQTVPLDTLVFATRPLREGWQLENTARFGDDEWDLSPALLQKQQKTIKLAFHTLPAAYRQVAKEIFYAILALEPPPGEVTLGIVSARSRFSTVKYFLTWLESIGSPRMDSLDLETLDRFHRKLIKETTAGLTARTSKRRALRTFFLFRHLLPTDHLVVDPAELEGWKDDPIAHRRARENTTERIPEPVLAPVVTWALRLIDDFAEDILAGRDEYLSLFRRSDIRRDGRLERGAGTKRLIAVLEDFRVNNRPLPRAVVDFRGEGRARVMKPVEVNFSHLARLADCGRDTAHRGLRHLVQELVAEVGIDDDTYLSHQPSALLDGKPWMGKIPFLELPKLARLLHTACYIVIAYLSGMRDSENGAELHPMQHSAGSSKPRIHR
ncbi:hypothetical protein ABZW10_13390 [Kitasatospora sp. NPDC004723]|uniref:hypothetical protein n=1 Tax=Kitasatospora sp. NPDC004723 TaxID=3154288 RepID=UPI0033BC9CFC